MNYQALNNRRAILLVTTLIIFLSALFSAGQVSAFLGLSGPKIDVALPNYIEEGGLVPINIIADGFKNDPITMVIMSIDGNPENHQHAFSLKLDKPQAMVLISTRIRMAFSDSNYITVRINQLSGNVTTKSIPTGTVGNPVSFSEPDSLNVTFKGSFVFPTDEIGQPQLAIKKKNGDNTELEIRGILHHPMAPAANDSSGFYVNSVDIFYENEKIASFEIGDTLSNDPYVQLNIKDKRNVGSAKMVWRDTKGFSYEASK